MTPQEKEISIYPLSAFTAVLFVIKTFFSGETTMSTSLSTTIL